MEFHRHKKSEKNYEINKRIKMLSEQPINIANGGYLNQFNQDIDVRDFNNKWAFKPIELYGRFDHGNELKVKTVKNGFIGFNLVTPFHFLNEDTNQKEAILVDRGFIGNETSIDNYDVASHNHSGYVALKGVLTKPHNTKYSKEIEFTEKICDHIDLKEMTKFTGIESTFAKNILIKSIDLNPENASVYPVTENAKSLTTFNVSPETHSTMSRLFGGVAFLSIFSNMFFWVCL